MVDDADNAAADDALPLDIPPAADAIAPSKPKRRGPGRPRKNVAPVPADPPTKTRTRTRAPRSTSKPRSTSPNRGDIERNVNRWIATTGLALYARPTTRADGLIVLDQSEALARSLTNVAMEHPRIAQALSAVTSPEGELAMLALSIGLGIARNHGATMPPLLDGIAARPPADTNVPIPPVTASDNDRNDAPAVRAVG